MNVLTNNSLKYILNQNKNKNFIYSSFFIDHIHEHKNIDYEKCVSKFKLNELQVSLVELTKQLKEFNIDPVHYQILFGFMNDNLLIKYSSYMLSGWNKIYKSLNDVKPKIQIKEIKNNEKIHELFNFFLNNENIQSVDIKKHRIFFFIENTKQFFLLI